MGSSGSGRARGVLQVWVWWERFTNWREKVRPVGPNSFLRYSTSHYSGKDRILADGTTVRHGETIIELHFNNPYIAEMIVNGEFTPWRGMRLAARDIAVLEAAIMGGNLPDVRAIHAVTLFAAVGPRLGFELRPLPHSPYWALVRYFMVGLIALYHPDGWKHARRTRATLWPSEIWLGINTIRQRGESHAEAVVPEISEVSVGPDGEHRSD